MEWLRGEIGDELLVTVVVVMFTWCFGKDRCFAAFRLRVLFLSACEGVGMRDLLPCNLPAVRGVAIKLRMGVAQLWQAAAGSGLRNLRLRQYSCQPIPDFCK